MTPSVRGRGKALVAVLLVGSAAATGALAGFAAGIGWSVAGLPVLTPAALTGLVVAAVAADAARIGPLAVGRQVPRVWSQVFSPAVTAVLYGGRLGVGPLTILVTWLWWAAALAAAALGPGAAALAGTTFGAVRMLTVVAASELLRAAMPVRMARLRAVQPSATVAGGCAALALSAAAWL